ncbi:MAG: adenylate kinase [Chloroflexi bacterium]|nr:adenylate kinase [Chloroflexota bacterium]
MKVVLLGPPGAGKGTQAALLSQRLGLAHVATGDLFRKALSQGTPLGKQAKTYMDKGALVPDQVTIAMVMERLADPDTAAGVLFDGFPRNLVQAAALDEALKLKRTAVAAVVLVNVPDEELVRRLAGRWICRSCQTPYHLVNAPPTVSGKCDRCGGELYQRDDDKEVTVRRRLNVYHEQTAPLVDYYRKQGKLVEVDGTGQVEQVTQAIAAILQRKKVAAKQ